MNSLDADLATPFWQAAGGHVLFLGKVETADKLAETLNGFVERVAELETEIARLRAEAKHGERAWDQMRKRADAAEREVARLREGLRSVLPGVLGSELEYQTNAAYHACVHIARALLTEDTPGKDGAA